VSATVEDFRSTTVPSLVINKELVTKLEHEPGQRTFAIKVDRGMRPAQIPVGDCVARYDDDDDGTSAVWLRIPEELEDRVKETLLSDDPDSYATFIEGLHKLLDHYDKTKEDN